MKRAMEDRLLGFRPARRIWKPLIRRLVAGRWEPLVMEPAEVEIPKRLVRLGLYLHVPFCERLCPYCGYIRVRYDESLYRRYETAAHREIDLRAQLLNGSRAGGRWRPPNIVSLYVGGGTPTVRADGLARLLAHIYDAFGLAGEVCVELHPAAMDDACLEILKTVGVTMVSIGVESLSDRLLGLIGRSHDAATATDAVHRAVAKDFDTVNVDLMFALPTQTLEEFDQDVQRVLATGVDQISTYPLFGFPYTQLGRKLGIKEVRRPGGSVVRAMLAATRWRSKKHGFRQCAVWSFIRPGKKKFSSVSRHHYLGIGPSAASMTGSQFHVNTFSVEEYASSLNGRLPVALVLPVDRRLEMAYWLYWRFYELDIPRAGFHEVFGEDLDRVYGRLLLSLKRLGALREQGDTYEVTEAAAYWIHRLQNEYTLDYIDRLWGRCRQEAWPESVRL